MARRMQVLQYYGNACHRLLVENTLSCGCKKAENILGMIISQTSHFTFGYFSEKEGAIAARVDAEKRLNEDPQAFVMEQGRKKELCV